MPPENPAKERRAADADLADAIMRVLKSQLGKQLRDKIKELAAND